jgi:hypothetical protein
MVLVGFEEKRGKAWHWRQGSDNHYEGAIPVSEVERRLFNWEPVTNLVKCPCGCGDTDKVVSRSDNRHRMGTFKEGYEPHSYKEWLLGSVSNILGDTLSVGSAGLLRKGAVAWVSVEVPDSITTPEGDHELRRFDRYHVQAGVHVRGVRQHPLGRARRDGTADQNQAHQEQ